jgi:hypothetical protein
LKSQNFFVNEPNTIEININSTNRVVYRFYNAPVAAENICETIPPATPTEVNGPLQPVLFK